MKQNSQFLRDQIILKHYGQFELGPRPTLKNILSAMLSFQLTYPQTCISKTTLILNVNKSCHSMWRLPWMWHVKKLRK